LNLRKPDAAAPRRWPGTLQVQRNFRPGLSLSHGWRHPGGDMRARPVSHTGLSQARRRYCFESDSALSTARPASGDTQRLVVTFKFKLNLISVTCPAGPVWPEASVRRRTVAGRRASVPRPAVRVRRRGVSSSVLPLLRLARMKQSRNVSVQDMATQHGDGRVDSSIQEGKRRRYSRWSFAEEQALLEGVLK
jgi:hypothetical protein